MSVATTVNQINNQALVYLPAIIAGTQIAEASGASGEDKFHAVLDTVSGISGAVAQIPNNPTVAGIAGLINLSVALANFFGKFKHATPAAA